MTCSVCGGQGGTCNRAVCGLPRTLTASFSVDGKIIELEAEIPPRVHRSRIETEMRKHLPAPQ